MTASQPVLDLMSGSTGNPPNCTFTGAKVWSRSTLSPNDWTVSVGDLMKRELSTVVAQLRRQKLPMFMLDPAYFSLDASRVMMSKAKRMVDDGHGFAILDRLPLDDWSEEEARCIYWLLGRLFARPAMQTADGMVFREIRNDNPNGDNGAHNDLRLAFHTDNSGNRCVPNYTSLLALYGAKEGGLSMYCTLYALCNAMAEDAPAQLERLFQPYYHDRQGIQSSGEPDVIRAPAIGYDGIRLSGRFSMNKIPAGYRKAGEPMDNLTRDSLDTVMAVIEQRDLAAKYMVGRGQLLIFNNREGLHHREAFKDGERLEEKRHLIRMWFRNDGLPFFDG